MAFDFERVAVQSVMKLYGSTRALVSVDVEFDASQVTVIEGPNGAGKSTLLNVLGLQARPTRGHVFFGEQRVAKATAVLRRRIGLLAHAPMVYDELSARENLRLFAGLYGQPSGKEAIDALCERFEIGSFGARPARTYSRGQLQRLSLARSLLHAPRLLLLDEPSTGLDAHSLRRLERTVDEEKARGAIVVVITHDEGFAERIATRRVRLERGRIVPPDSGPFR